jgi:hypothetical protein
MINEEIICAFSGLIPKEDEYVESSDELGDMPIDWTKITIQTRRENPDWSMLQAVKVAMVQQLEGQLDEKLGEDEKNVAKYSIRLQVEAQFASLEERMSPHLIEEQTTFVSDISKNDEIKGMYDQFLELLDLKEDEVKKE